jgi:predicted small metal-binding protein
VTYEFSCGSPVCSTHFTAPTKDELMGKVGAHVLHKHHIAKPTKSLVQFLEANTIREVPRSGEAGRS